MVDPHGEYSAAFKGHGELFNVDNLAMPYWLMNFEEHCEVFVTSQGAERQRDMRHPRQMPAPGARQEPRRRGALQAHRRFADPLPLSDLTNADHPRNGPARTRRPTPRRIMRLKTKIDELKSDPRYQFMFSGMLVADTMGAFIAQDLPPAGATASRSRSSTCRACRRTSSRWSSRCSRGWCSIMRSGRAAKSQRPVLLVCEEAHRYVPSDKTSTGQAVRKILERIAKEGRKYGVSLGPDHAAPVRSRRGRALAMRHDHRDAPQQRSRPGVREAAMPEGARGFLDSSRRSATASASSAARASRSRSASRSTISSATAARPRPTRSSRSCGGRPAKRKRWSPASSSAGARRGGRSVIPAKAGIPGKYSICD